MSDSELTESVEIDGVRFQFRAGLDGRVLITLPPDESGSRDAVMLRGEVLRKLVMGQIERRREELRARVGDDRPRLLERLLGLVAWWSMDPTMPEAMRAKMNDDLALFYVIAAPPSLLEDALAGYQPVMPPRERGSVLWFGESWGAPICDQAYHTLTPVGQMCLRCERPIQADSQGIVTAAVDHEGRATMRPWHLDCFLGSVGIGAYLRARSIR